VALADLERVALYAVAGTLGPGLGPLRGKGQIHAMLARVATLEAGGTTDLSAGVATLVERHRRPGVAVVLSDFYDQHGHEAALERLRHARFEPVVVQIVAAEEAAPELAGEVALVDAETGEERSILVTPKVAAAYRERYAQRQHDLRRFCHGRAIPCLQVLSDHPLEDLVLRLFRAGGILR
jgi:hypothetical protein